MDINKMNITITICIILLLLIICNIFMSCKNRENFYNIDDNNIFEIVNYNQGNISFKRNNQGNLVSITENDYKNQFRGHYNSEKNQNYIYHNVSLVGNGNIKMPTPLPALLNLITDFFDFCWDKNKHRWKEEFVIGFWEGFYYDRNNQILFLSYRFCKDKLVEFGVIHNNHKQYMHDCLLLCKLICKSTGFNMMYKSESKSIPIEYSFFLLTKNSYNINIECKSSINYPCKDNSPLVGQQQTKYKHKLINKYTMFQSKINKTIEEKHEEIRKQGIHELPKAEDVDLSNEIDVGIPFQLGNHDIVHGGAWNNRFFNNILFNKANTSLCTVTIPDNHFVGKDATIPGKGNLIDQNYIESMVNDSVSYTTEFLMSAMVRNGAAISESNYNSTPNNNFGLSLSWNQAGGGWKLRFSPGAADFKRGQNKGMTDKIDRFSITKTNDKRYGIGWDWGRGTWDFNIATDMGRFVSIDYYADIKKGSWVDDIQSIEKIINVSASEIQPLEYDKKKNKISIGRSMTSPDCITSIQIDDNKGIYVTTNNNNIHYIYNLKDYNLTPEDLTGNPCWLCHAQNHSGRLGTPHGMDYKNNTTNIIGCNGGNSQFITNSKGTMRFYFNIFGSFIAEAYIRRDYINKTERKNLIEKFDNEFKKNFDKFQISRDKGFFINAGNFKGTPYTTWYGAYLILMVQPYNIFNDDNDEINSSSILPDKNIDNNPYIYSNLVTSGNGYNNAIQENWIKFPVESKTSNCKNWFKYSNVNKAGEIDFNKIPQLKNTGLIKHSISAGSPENNKKLHITEKLDTTSKALNICSELEDCYGVSCKKSSGSDADKNICELWKKDGIQHNFSEIGVFGNKGKYNTYIKGCVNINNQNFVDKGYQTGNEIMGWGNDFGITGITFNYGNDEIDSAVLHHDINKHVKITDKLIKQYVSENINNLIDKNANSFYNVEDVSIKVNNDIKNNDNNYTESKAKIAEIIIRNKDKIIIKFAEQTNRENFKLKLKNQIQQNILLPILRNVSLYKSAIFTDKKQDADSTIISTAELATETTTQTSSSSENFTNINNKIKLAHDKIIKNCIYNISDYESINDLNNNQKNLFNNKNNVDTIILLILIIITIVIFIKIINSKK